jgi:hypothetical protein
MKRDVARMMGDAPKALLSQLVCDASRGEVCDDNLITDDFRREVVNGVSDAMNILDVPELLEEFSKLQVEALIEHFEEMEVIPEDLYNLDDE